jgi:hypothetical protein
MDLKYVRHNTVGFILWPRTDDLWHMHVASALPRGSIMSAGFASVAGGKVKCGGRSESLGIGSLPEDGAALAKQLGLNPPS